MMLDVLFVAVPTFFQWLRDTPFYGHLSIMDFLVVVLLIGLLIAIVTPYDSGGD